jgi:hypothetical protein
LIKFYKYLNLLKHFVNIFIKIEEELKGSSNLFVIGGIVILISFGVYFVMSVKQAINEDEVIKKK